MTRLKPGEHGDISCALKGQAANGQGRLRARGRGETSQHLCQHNCLGLICWGINSSILWLSLSVSLWDLSMLNGYRRWGMQEEVLNLRAWKQADGGKLLAQENPNQVQPSEVVCSITWISGSKKSSMFPLVYKELTSACINITCYSLIAFHIPTDLLKTKCQCWCHYTQL